MKLPEAVLVSLALVSSAWAVPPTERGREDSCFSILTLCPDCQCAFRVNGIGTLLTTAPIQVNSTNQCSGCGHGIAQIVTPAMNLVGPEWCDTPNVDVFGPINTGVDPLPDPLAGLPTPDFESMPDRSCTYQPGATLEPGYYETGIRHEIGDLSLNPGVYVLGGPENTALPPTTVNFDGDFGTFEHGVTVPGATDFSLPGSEWTGGVVDTFPFVGQPNPDEPPPPTEYPLSASGRYSYAFNVEEGTVTFDPPVRSAEFFYVHDIMLGVAPGTATAIDTCGNVAGIAGSSPATFFNDPANFVDFTVPTGGHPIRRIEFSGGAIDAFNYAQSLGGLHLGHGTTLNARGVMFHVAGGAVNIQGLAEVVITPIDPETYKYPPTEAIYDGLSFFVARGNHNQVNLLGTSDMYIRGIIYASGSRVMGGGRPAAMGDQWITHTAWLHAEVTIDPGCGGGLPVVLMIKPGECVAPLNPRSQGVLPVLAVANEFVDLSQVDLSSLQLSRADGVGGSVDPNEGPPGPHSTVEDLAYTESYERCTCNDNLFPDGRMDLSMKFRTARVVDALELRRLPIGEVVDLVLRGNLIDGTLFEGRDCIQIVGRGELETAAPSAREPDQTRNDPPFSGPGG